MSKTSSAHCIGLVFLLILGSSPLHAAVNDVFPGDYYASDQGTTTTTLYAYDRTSEGPYAHGRKLLEGRLDSRILALRLTRAYELGGMTVSPIVVFSALESEVSPPSLAASLGNRTSGMGDLRLGVTFWPIKDRKNAEYLGFTYMVIAPTGEYSGKQVINVGENRWRFVFAGGWQKAITQKLLLELSPEMAFYRDNTDYIAGKRLEQSASYALSAYLRYRVSTAWHVFLGAQQNRGGATSINGVAQNNPANNTRWTTGISWFLPEQQQVIVRFGLDTSIDNGFRTDREVAVRYSKSF